jgi:hypothetical protein
MDILSITSAQVVIIGAQFVTVDRLVVLELECQASRAISSTVTPDSDMTEANVCRNSRRAHTLAIPAFLPGSPAGRVRHPVARSR